MEKEDFLSSVTKTPLESEICNSLNRFIENPRSDEDFKNLILPVLRYTLQDAKVVNDVNIPVEDARLLPHQFCSLCFTNRSSEPEKSEERELRFKIQVCMIKLFGFKHKRWIPIWSSALANCIYDCIECYKGYLRARRELCKLLSTIFASSDVATFANHTLKWEEQFAIDLLRKQDNQKTVSPAQTYASLELTGILTSKGIANEVHAEVRTRMKDLPISSLQEFPSGLIAIAMDEDESVREWADKQTDIPVMSVEMASQQPTVGLLMGKAMEKGRFNALTLSMQMAPSAFTGSALPNTLLGHLSDDLSQTTSILQCFEKLLNLKGWLLWEQEDREYPLVVLSSILDSPHFATCLTQASSSTGLLGWTSPLIASLIPPIDQEDRQDKQFVDKVDRVAGLGPSLKTFEEGLKRIAHFLFERVQQGQIPVAVRIIAASQCCAIILQRIPSWPLNGKEDKAQVQDRSIIAILNQVTDLHSHSIANFAFGSKIPNSSDIVKIEPDAFLTAQQLVEAIFYLSCESTAEDIMTLSTITAQQQRSYKRLLKEHSSKGQGSKSIESTAKNSSGSVFESAFKDATNELYLAGTVSTELWKACYVACQPARDLDVFIRPLSALAPFVDLDVTTFIIQVKDVHMGSKAYQQYRERLKMLISTLNRWLRAMRDTLPGFLQDSADASLGRKNDLEPLCYKSADSIIITTLSAEETIHKAAQNLIRSVFEDAESRSDCFAKIFQCNVSLALKGIHLYLDSFVRAASSLIEANNAAKWMVRSFSDILEILCSPTDGLLRTGTPFSLIDRPNEAGRVRARLPFIWSLMCQSIAVIFKRTPSWSRILPHEELTAWFRDVTIFASDAIEQVELFQKASTLGIDDTEKRYKIRSCILEDLSQSLEEASSWFRMNNMEIVQETRDYFVKGLSCYRNGASLPQAAKDRILAFIDTQSKIEDDEERPTLLSLAELAELRMLIEPRKDVRLEKVASKDVDKRPISSINQKETRISITDNSDPIVVSVRKSSLSKESSSLQNLKQQRLPFQRTDGKPSSLLSAASREVPLPPQPRLATASTGSVNRYQGATARPVATTSSSTTPTTTSRPSGKMAQLRQDFRANHTIYKPVNTGLRMDRTNTRELPEPRAPEAKRSFNSTAFSRLATAGTNSVTGGGKHGENVGESSSEDSDSSEEGTEKLGLADLAGGKKTSPAKMRTKIRTINEPQKRTVLLENDDAMQRAKRQSEDAERKRRLREPANFSPLHRIILNWPLSLNNSDLPSSFNSIPPSRIKSTYRNADEYVDTFQPMLLLECWAQLQAAQEQMQKNGAGYTPFAATITGRSSTDAFDSLAITIQPSRTTAQQLFLQDTDIIYIRDRVPSKDGKRRIIMAKVDAFKFHPQGPRLTVRCCLTTDEQGMSSALVQDAQIEIGKLLSLTTLHREYAALQSVQFYDMLSSILWARSAPKESTRIEDIKLVQDDYSVNRPQAEAILSAVNGQRGFQLIQGPPGTGKTKTICSLIAHFIQTRKAPAIPIRAGQQVNGTTAYVKKKIFLCAPSNAAVDEVASRVHLGIRGKDGKLIKPNVVRVGREEAMNVAVKEISLESIVEKRLDASKQTSSQKDIDSMDPAQIQAEIRALKDQLDNKRQEIESFRISKASEKIIEQLESEKNVLLMKRLKLTNKLDEAKDARQTVNRQQDADRRRIQQEILMQADVVCSTLAGAGHPLLSSLPFDFETVVIDEAAQAVELDTLIPLRYGCQKCILVGDPNQLPPTIISREAEKLHYSQSLFVRLFNNPKNFSNLLSIQYRMHPYISQFPSNAFYDGKLQDGPNMAELTEKPWHSDQLLRPVRFFDCRGSYEGVGRGGHSLVNKVEAVMACKIYARLRREARKLGTSSALSSLDGKIGVVTMYKDQVFALKRAFRDAYGEGIEDVVDFNTVDGFQGQEKDVIILSCVRSNGIGFLNDYRRINVAITRAKSNLFIIANVPNLEKNDRDGIWKKFIDIARKNEDLVTVSSEDFDRPAMNHTSPQKRGKLNGSVVTNNLINNDAMKLNGQKRQAEKDREDDLKGVESSKRLKLDSSSNTSEMKGLQTKTNHIPQRQLNVQDRRPLKPSAHLTAQSRPIQNNASTSNGVQSSIARPKPQRPLPPPAKAKTINAPTGKSAPIRPAGNPIAIPGQIPAIMTPAAMAASRFSRPPPRGPAIHGIRRPPLPDGPSEQARASMFMPKPSNRKSKR